MERARKGKSKRKTANVADDLKHNDAFDSVRALARLLSFRADEMWSFFIFVILALFPSSSEWMQGVSSIAASFYFSLLALLALVSMRTMRRDEKWKSRRCRPKQNNQANKTLFSLEKEFVSGRSNTENWDFLIRSLSSDLIFDILDMNNQSKQLICYFEHSRFISSSYLLTLWSICSLFG